MLLIDHLLGIASPLGLSSIAMYKAIVLYTCTTKSKASLTPNMSQNSIFEA